LISINFSVSKTSQKILRSEGASGDPTQWTLGLSPQILPSPERQPKSVSLLLLEA
jgi:hypothetical protein